MKTTLYFIRHAQSRPTHDVHHERWPLSETGLGQAERLAHLLDDLKIEKIFSSPFDRCLQTVEPLKAKKNIHLEVHHDLRERLIETKLSRRTDHIWERSWEDLHYAEPGCESSVQAQVRFVKAVKSIVESHKGMTLGISSHCNVIALFFNHLDENFKREHAELIRNPDVFKLTAHNDSFLWHGDFSLDGLDDIATHYSQTPISYEDA